MGVSHMVRGGHELPKVLLGPAIHSAVGPPLKQPFGISGVVRPQGGRPVAIFYPVGHPIPSALVGPPKKVGPRGPWGG
jgi:hypothetical protein